MILIANRALVLGNTECLHWECANLQSMEHWRILQRNLKTYLNKENMFQDYNIMFTLHYACIHALFMMIASLAVKV